MMYIIDPSLKHHSLYRLQDESFFSPKNTDSLGSIPRRNFEKTGSKTTLLGGSLAGKIIVREIAKKNLDAWKIALNPSFWQSRGFSYVPIEPIAQKNGKPLIIPQKNGKFRVYTRVLGPHLSDFASIPSNQRYTVHINHLMQGILDGLTLLGVDHHHAHSHNYTVSLDSHGLRLYLIDFDDAALDPGKHSQTS